MQNLPPSGSLPPQSNWANTVPTRSRGRGRLRPEELDGTAGSIFRPVTPEQYSAPSSRSHTPSQEYTRYTSAYCYIYRISRLNDRINIICKKLLSEHYKICADNRSYDRRGSNSTMYTSMESLSRADSVMMPPPSSASPATSQSNSNRGHRSPENHRRGATSPTDNRSTSNT